MSNSGPESWYFATLLEMSWLQWREWTWTCIFTKTITTLGRPGLFFGKATLGHSNRWGGHRSYSKSQRNGKAQKLQLGWAWPHLGHRPWAEGRGGAGPLNTWQYIGIQLIHLTSRSTLTFIKFIYLLQNRENFGFDPPHCPLTVPTLEVHVLSKDEKHNRSQTRHARSPHRVELTRLGLDVRIFPCWSWLGAFQYHGGSMIMVVFICCCFNGWKCWICIFIRFIFSAFSLNSMFFSRSDYLRT